MQTWIKDAEEAKNVFDPNNWVKQNYDTSNIPVNGQMKMMAQQFLNLFSVHVNRRGERMKAYLLNNSDADPETIDKVSKIYIRNSQVNKAKLFIVRTEHVNKIEKKILLGNSDKYISILNLNGQKK